MLGAKMALGTCSSHVVPSSVTLGAFPLWPLVSLTGQWEQGHIPSGNCGMDKADDAGETPGIVEGGPYKPALFLLSLCRTLKNKTDLRGAQLLLMPCDTQGWGAVREAEAQDTANALRLRLQGCKLQETK